MPPKRDINEVNANVNSFALNDVKTSSMTPSSSSSPTTFVKSASTVSLMKFDNDNELAAEQRQQLYIANSKLCRMVRKSPWIYNRKHCNYGKKYVLDRTWLKISKECNDSVASCKERWRNIRAAFARSVNIYKTPSGPNRIKPYYLHKELSFLMKPMLEGRDKTNTDNGTETLIVDQEDQVEEMSDISNEAWENEQPTQSNHDIDLTSANKTELDDSVPSPKPSPDSAPDQMLAMKYDESSTHSTPAIEAAPNAGSINEATADDKQDAPQTQLAFKPTPCLKHTESSSDDVDVMFLDTLLPEMRAMNARQKIIFKRKIYQVLEEVFDSTTDFPVAPSAQPRQHQHQLQNVSSNLTNIFTSTPKNVAVVIPHDANSNFQPLQFPIVPKEELQDNATVS